jgi:hypothetical protein
VEARAFVRDNPNRLRSVDRALDATNKYYAARAGAVGLVLACTLMALLPKLGTMARKQVAALVGVAPYAFESGIQGTALHLGRSCARP